MFWAAVILSFLILSINEVHPLRGGLVRNGRAYDESNGDSNKGEPFSLIKSNLPSNAGYKVFYVRPFQEFMRFGRSISFPGAQQNFVRARQDNPNEVESVGFE